MKVIDVAHGAELTNGEEQADRLVLVAGTAAARRTIARFDFKERLPITAIIQSDGEERLHIDQLRAFDVQQSRERRFGQQRVVNHAIVIRIALDIEGQRDIDMINVEWADRQVIRRQLHDQAVKIVGLVHGVRVRNARADGGLADREHAIITVASGGFERELIVVRMEAVHSRDGLADSIKQVQDRLAVVRQVHFQGQFMADRKIRAEGTETRGHAITFLSNFVVPNAWLTANAVATGNYSDGRAKGKAECRRVEMLSVLDDGPIADIRLEDETGPGCDQSPIDEGGYQSIPAFEPIPAEASADRGWRNWRFERKKADRSQLWHLIRRNESLSYCVLPSRQRRSPVAQLVERAAVNR